MTFNYSLDPAIAVAMTPMGTLFQKKSSRMERKIDFRVDGLTLTSRYIHFMTEKTGARHGGGEPVRADHPHAQIASKLRALYVSVQEEAVPDRFLDLLEQLDAVERRHAPDGSK